MQNILLSRDLDKELQFDGYKRPTESPTRAPTSVNVTSPPSGPVDEGSESNEISDEGVALIIVSLILVLVLVLAVVFNRVSAIHK